MSLNNQVFIVFIDDNHEDNKEINARMTAISMEHAIKRVQNPANLLCCGINGITFPTI